MHFLSGKQKCLLFLIITTVHKDIFFLKEIDGELSVFKKIYSCLGSVMK